MIELENGHKVLAEIVNGEFDVDGKRKGGAVVIAFDYDHGTAEVSDPRFVTWICWPSWRGEQGHFGWIAEQGHYGLTWEGAWEDMVERSHTIKRNQFVIRGVAAYG